MHILLVEDNEIAQMLCKNMLEITGCVVDTASNGQQALSLYQENNYSVIFLDIGLPDMSGVDVAHRMCHDNIVGISAHATVNKKELCINAGMRDLQQKPLTIEVLKQFL